MFILPGPVQSEKGSSGLRVILRTDHEGVYSGFDAIYTFKKKADTFNSRILKHISNFNIIFLHFLTVCTIIYASSYQNSSVPPDKIFINCGLVYFVVHLLSSIIIILSSIFFRPSDYSFIHYNHHQHHHQFCLD